jgi:glycerol kinase
MALYLCLDQGGHASRALVLDGQGTEVARAVREVATRQPAPQRVEQDPEEVVRSLVAAAREALAALGARRAEVRAAGLATQRSSIVCWDRVTGAALSPVISWQDRRAADWLAQFEPQRAEIERRTGLRLSPHYGCSKLRWCLEHLEAARAAQREARLAVGPLASFLAFRLLEERPLIVDPANAQRTLLWNLAQRAWDPWLLQLFGLTSAPLPETRATRDGFGHIAVEGAPLPLVVITGDQSAALFGLGAPRAEAAYVNLGTGAFVQRAIAAPAPVDGLLTGIAFQYHEQATYTLEGTVNGAGAALAWAVRRLDLPNLEARLSAWLERETEAPLFLNGIGGLGAPYWVADFESCFIGVGEPWQEAVAVAESIVFQIAAIVQRCVARGGEPASALIVSGGLAAVDGLCQRLADVAGVPVSRAAAHEATARGLAWLLAGGPPWPAPAGTDFAPRAGTAASVRYQAWRKEMQRRCPRA